jgi:ABC-type lipoprotein release transport system permease subunit
MILANLFRRRGRTFLTLLGVGLGVGAIIALGAMAEGLRAGYFAMTEGSKADMVLSQAGAMDITLGGVEQSTATEVGAWPEVSEISGVLMGYVRAEEAPYFFIFGYEPTGFPIQHFKIVSGVQLSEAEHTRGAPCLLGRAAADNLDKAVGDTLHITGGTYRIVGIYETGDALEEGGAVISLAEAQELLLQPNRASMYYLRLTEPSLESRVRQRVERRFPDLVLSNTADFVNQQDMIKYLGAFAWGIAAIAIVIGGMVMTNTLFMSVFERTGEIGLLRAMGWSRARVMGLIFGESLVLALLGGLVGTVFGVGLVTFGRSSLIFMSVMGANFTPELFARAFVTVGVMGLVGGLLPAWWASRLMPLEALQHEGGVGARVPKRLPGGMTIRNLWRRQTRTALTALGVGVGIAAIIALGGMGQGFIEDFNAMSTGSEADLMATEADAADMGYSTIEERIGERISALPEVAAVSGIGFAMANTEQLPILLISGYNPREFAIEHHKIVAGSPLQGSRQILLGRQAADALDADVGETIRLLDSTFRVVGIYDTGVAWQDSGAVISLRDAQKLAGRPHQVTMFAIKLKDPQQADSVQRELEARFPEITVSRTSEFAESIPDLRNMGRMVGEISFMAIIIGTVGMMNTMLMSVLERTREIGLLRAIGWKGRQILAMILREAVALGGLGGLGGICLGLVLAWSMTLLPWVGEMLRVSFPLDLFLRATAIAVVTGVIGGIYPAWRAIRLRPVEALRYE